MSDRSEVYRHQSASEAVDPESSMGNELAFITVPKPVVLDVGCACGDFGAMLKRERNAELYGLEYDAGSIEIALSIGAYTRIDQQNLDSLTHADYPEYRGKFDYIVCGDVLEHLRDPIHVLSILKTYLKTEGHIVASIPNVAHMSVKANLLDDTFDYMPVGLLDKTHVHLFSHKSISEDLASVGLRIFSCRFTLQEKEGMQPHQPYEKLPVSVLKLLFEDWHSYVCQYVMLIGEDAHPAQTLAFLNELAIQIDETTAPESIRSYRENLLKTYLPSRGPDREEMFQALADERKERLEELCREGDRLRAEVAELRTERATESAAREKLEIESAQLREETERLRAEVVELNKACDRWATDKVRVEKEKLEAERLLAELRASPSWRITAPLRFLKHKAKGGLAGLRRYYTTLSIWYSERRIRKSLAGAEIVFDHNLGGGANDYRERYVAARLSEGVSVLVFHNNLEYYQNRDQNRDFTIRIYTPERKDGIEHRFDSWPAARSFIAGIRLSRIVYNNLVYNPNVGEIVKWIGQQKTNLLMMIHDFYPVCQFYLMTTAEGRYCHGKDCDACAKTQGDQRHLFGTLRSADEWRRLWSPLFERAAEIRVFSPFATQVLEIFHPGISARVVCWPHDMSYFKGTPIELDKGTGLKVGVVGSIYNVAKGAKVVEDYAKSLPDGERLTIIGTYSGNPCEKLEITGRYSHEELGALLVRYGINVVLFPSVCPETFSYTVSELMQMRVPIIAFDVGAQGCKVSEYDRGALILEQSVDSIQHTAQALYNKVYGGMK